MLHLKIALRWRKPRFGLCLKITRVAKARLFFLIIAPFNLPAFRRFWIASIAHISGVALVTQERVANVFASAFKFIERSKECQRMINRHNRQIFANHFSNRTAPKTCTHNDIIRMNSASMSNHTLDTPIFNN